MANTFDLDHVSLFVRNLDISARFYAEVLRLPEIEKKSTRANVRWFGLGAGRAIHLILGATDVPASRPRSTHFALASSSFDEALRQLAGCGVARAASKIDLAQLGRWEGQARSPNGCNAIVDL